ncbi:O-antigen ligase domain-containing protein [Leptolyngbya sp. FACHB-36]|uniref:O-antigen ligase domain-containing protein n=1 Tax=Leptolyngbya sp. FACHB-36 TaxID=2692808 RepID=UPI00168098EC|nr:O-antigen ligase domain-containing protein [Leptolyngbya sp. FACHB-36]MBD2022476.1 O-antigen ligase domain-containing protein [Leptolyngbya sp. FACHB-36]
MPASTRFRVHISPSWFAIAALVALTALCLLVRVGGVLRLVFPAGCFVVGSFLYVYNPTLYVGFTWWVWFLSPWVRRLVDVQAGWVDPSPLLLAPFLTTLVTIVTLVRYLPGTYSRGGLPFLLALLGVVYGFLVGLINAPITATIVPLLNWLTPILFGFHLFAHWRDYPQYRDTLQRTFLWSVLVMGTYGVVQYLTAPAWDRFWLSNQETLVFGTPEPLSIRVFSTMNSPQPFAFVLAAGLLLVFSGQGTSRFFGAIVGYLSFLLSLARSAWLGWAVSLLWLIPALKPRLQIRVILSLLVLVLLVFPLTTIEPFSNVIQTRLQTLGDVGSDTSYAARSQGYSEALGIALNQVLGQGLGSTLPSDSLGSNDSGVLSLLFTLGWLGTLPYVAGLGLLLFYGAGNSMPQTDTFGKTAQAIVLGALAQIGLNNVMLGVFGMVLWSFLGMTIAAQRYGCHQPVRE